MNEKKMNLIESGMKLFAQKGYHTTSIQEIAAAAGVSKGTFYLYFQSKEDFIKTAMLYYHEEINRQLEKVKKQQLEPRKSLAKQIEVVMDYIYEYKEFITMQLRENIAIGENIDSLFRQMKVQNYQWLRENIQAIYGEELYRYYVDIIIQLEGLMNGYFKWIILENIDFDRNQLAQSIVRRIDDIVEGMVSRNDAPFLTEGMIPELYRQKGSVTNLIKEIKEKIPALKLSEEKQQQLLEAADLIEMECSKKAKNNIMIQGLLVHFQRVAALKHDCEQLAAHLGIELLD